MTIKGKIKKCTAVILGIAVFISCAALSGCSGSDSEAPERPSLPTAGLFYEPADEEKEPSALDIIGERGVLRVGTPGDCEPMSYKDPITGKYAGLDTELAKDLTERMGLELEFVPTTRAALGDDAAAGKFDIAICGITAADEYKDKFLLSDGYLGVPSGDGEYVMLMPESSEDVLTFVNAFIQYERDSGRIDELANKYISGADAESGDNPAA